VRDKRQHPRATLVTVVEICRSVPLSDHNPLSVGSTSSPTSTPSPGSSQERSVEVESRDISNGGIFLAGPSPWPEGTELVLIFDLPGVGRSQIPGFIRWHRADGFGVQFGLLGARETHAIGRLIRSQNGA
jgi:hypothetical protein